MDSSFTNALFNKGSYTPRTRQSSASSMLSSRKSLHSGLKKGLGSSRFSLSGRSVQSQQIIAKSDGFVVESYGLPLPVLVNEALTFSERNAAVTINCANNGWAWAVCNRRLLVWQYKEYVSDTQVEIVRTPQRRAPTGQCRELTLPHCDIGHKASLITVFIGDGQQMASCLAVSPTGDIRYWPSIAHDGSSIDSTGILEGQEFDELVSLTNVGYVLATTTCNLVLLQLQLNSGRHTIVHRAIRTPTGFLGGFGKKFASIIIGMNSAQDRENKLIRISAQNDQNSDWNLTVLADRWIQRWNFSANGNESFLFEDLEVLRRIRDAFHQKMWSHRDINEVEVRLLDMHVAFDGTTLILAAAINPAHTPQFQYGVITLVESASANSYSLRNFCTVKHCSFVTSSTIAGEVLNMRLLVNGQQVYCYDEKLVHQLTLSLGDLCGNGEPTEKIEFPAQGDKLMAATVHQRLPLFFSRLYGLVAVSPVDADGNDYFNSSVVSEHDTTAFLSQSLAAGQPDQGNLTMLDLNPDEVYDSDAVSQLKAAFIYHLKKMPAKCSEVLIELLDNASSQEFRLDEVVVAIARDLVEDIPAADPRWEDQVTASRHALGSSASMQILQQLKEKKLVLNHFVEFLHSTELWTKMGTMNDRGSLRCTAHLLADVAEKTVAACSLKRIHQSHSRLIDDAIQIVLRQRSETVGGNLTPQDLFYVKVTRIHEFFKALAGLVANDTAGQSDNGNLSTRVSVMLSDVNTIMLTVLTDVLKYRDTKRSLFAARTPQLILTEYIPWTALPGKNGLRDTIHQQITMTLKQGARATGEPELRQRHYKQMVELIDILLDGTKSYLDSLAADTDKYTVLLQQYEAQRNDLIQPLVDDGQFELATKLAEKYLDFQILLQICDRTDNQQRLDEYIAKYAPLNFSQFAINWHLKQNKRGDLFERFKHQQADLSRFLMDHPSLAWVQAVFNGDLDKAGRVLYELAANETELIDRKKTMLSLAKLVSLAADDDMRVQINSINGELRLIEFQKQVPVHLLRAFGYEETEQKVLKAEEIVNLLISEENEMANEVDYRRALELLAFVDDAVEVRHKIWCAAILRDDWTTYNINAPQEDLQNMLFFKLVDLCFFMDTDLEEFLPPIDDFLDAPELSELVGKKSFQFLFKLGYEYIAESYRQRQEA